MKKYNIPPGIVLTLMLTLMALVLNAKTMDPQMDLEIQNRVNSLSSVINVQYNNKVKSKIWHLIHSHRTVSETMLGRSTLYFPLIEGILRERNMPDDLKYIAVIESGLNPNALSRVKATGMWQFMKPTAKWIGLKINRAVDERRDPIKSTYAAIDYLEKLHNQFGDWTLALAAYNCGPGNVRKAIRKAGGVKDYWSIQRFLPRETRNYIPKMIAMHYMMNYYYAHDLWPKQVDENLKFTASVKVFDQVKLRDIAKEYQLDFEIVKKLNPSYLKNFIPASEGKHYLTLPESHLYAYVDQKNAHDHMFHVSTLAAKPIKTIASTKTKESVPPKEKIESRKLAPITPLVVQNKAIIQMRNPGKVVIVRLKRGQTIQDLSKTYDVPMSNIIRDNNITAESLPKLGDLILVMD